MIQLSRAVFTAFLLIGSPLYVHAQSPGDSAGTNAEPIWKPITPANELAPGSPASVTPTPVAPPLQTEPTSASPVIAHGSTETPSVPAITANDTGDEILQRLRDTEQRLRDLERRTGLESKEEDFQHAGFWKLLKTPEPDTQQALQESALAGAMKDGVKKKWYEKLSIRGYTQFRLNETVFEKPGSAPAFQLGDAAVGDSRNFFIRRARLIISGDISEHLFVYLQPDFAVTPPLSVDATHFTQIRDWYADVYLDKEKINRFRVGQSKVPYGWENLQSSSNRIPLDRNDAFNSEVKNERDVGVFYYWTPVYAQELYRYVLENNLKGSGNYGVVGLGAYNGQGGSFLELNNNIHLVGRINVPYQFSNGQIIEVGVQGIVGRYSVLSSPIRPLGKGSIGVRPQNTYETGNVQGTWEERLGWNFIYYPQPFGFQAEWTIGSGPALDATQTSVITRPVNGGYVQAFFKHDTNKGVFFPYARWQYFHGGYRAERNAPYGFLNETEFGCEWQIEPAMELTVAYSFSDRTNLRSLDRSGAVSYGQFVGQLLRFQFQFNY